MPCMRHRVTFRRDQPEQALVAVKTSRGDKLLARTLDGPRSGKQTLIMRPRLSSLGSLDSHLSGRKGPALNNLPMERVQHSSELLTIHLCLAERWHVRADLGLAKCGVDC